MSMILYNPHPPKKVSTGYWLSAVVHSLQSAGGHICYPITKIGCINLHALQIIH